MSKSMVHIHSKEKTRSRLFYAFVSISLLTIIFFSILFPLTDAAKALPYVSFFAVPHSLALILYRRGNATTAIGLAVGSSLSIVFIHTFFLFGNGAGFHYMYLALLIVIFLVSDMSILNQKVLSIIMSGIIIVAFMLCEAYAHEPYLVLYESLDVMPIRYIGLGITVIATSAMLYIYSKQLSINEQSLLHLASYDALTNIFNRGYFVDLGKQMFSCYKKNDTVFSVILMDIDDFKHINDTYGHPAGDQVLVETTALIKSFLVPEAILCRYGGEEFTILLPGAGHEAAKNTAEYIRQVVDQYTAYYDGNPIHLTASFGVSTAHAEFEEFDQMMVEADKLLYKSKLSGKNRVSVANFVA